jgi:hypothetical protein
MHHAVFEADALDASREVDRPADRIDVVATDPLDRRQFVGPEVLVPAELLQDPERELGVARP